MRAFFLLFPFLALARGALVFNILDYGAVGDNTTVNTAAIQRAIDAAAAAGAEAHVVVPPTGVFKTGALSLRSNVYLYLPSGSTLHGSAAFSAYTDVAGGDWDRWDVLHTRRAANTGVLGDAGGTGTLAGPMWQMIKGYDAAENQLVPVTWAGQHGCQGECRPRLLVFEDCANVTVRDVRLVDSADWTQLYRRTSNVLLANLFVWGSQQWGNNDGVDFESCANVTVRDSAFFTGDDGIVLASGNCNNMRAPWPEAWGNYTPTRDVLIENVTLSSYSAAIKWEAIDQAWHGDVINVTVRDVLIHDSNRGIGFQQRTGGGAFRDVLLERVRVLRTHGVTGETWWGAGEALWLTSLPQAPGFNYSLGGVHNVVLRDCELEGEQGGIVLAEGPTGTGAVSGLLLANATLRVGVYGNATRKGLHDLRPVNTGAQYQARNVSGWYFGGVGGAPGAGARVDHGVAEFVGAAQPWWMRGFCSYGDNSSGVDIYLMACHPAQAQARAPAYPANCSAGLPKQQQYSVAVLERSAARGGGALISKVNGSSAFNFSFTTAWFAAPGGGDGLIVRNVECNANHHSCAGVAHPEWGNAGALAVVAADLARGTAERVQLANVTWAGAQPPPASLKPAWGAIDPRAVFRPADGRLYLTFDNCSAPNCEPHRTTMLSTTRDPFNASGWTLHGPLLGPGTPYTAGAALLFRDGGLPGPHLAFVSDSNTAHNINVATSSDGLAWAPANKTLMAGRPGCWDAPGVAVGPQPERLASGDYLLLYNIDTGLPLRPNPYGRCSVGWAVLSGSDPTQVVARSDDALLVPTFPWETCAATGKGYACQEPQVVFSTGLKPLGNDEFLVIYGGADTDVGMAKIKVTTSAVKAG